MGSRDSTEERGSDNASHPGTCFMKVRGAEITYVTVGLGCVVGRSEHGLFMSAPMLVVKVTDTLAATAARFR